MRNILCGIILIAALGLMAGCSDHGNGAATEPTPDIAGAPVDLTALAAAVWGDASTATADVKCLAGSSFKIQKDKGFDIERNSAVTKELASTVLIVSPINIVFDGTASDGRGADCPAGAQAYLVPASQTAPIGIEASDAVRARQNLEVMASSRTATYPKCTIGAHFEKTGLEKCATSSDTTKPAGDDTTTPGDDTTTPGDGDNTGTNPIITRPIFKFPKLEPAGSTSGTNFIREPSVQKLSVDAEAITIEDKLPCGDQEVRAVKVVIDDVDCSTQASQFQQHPNSDNNNRPVYTPVTPRS